MPLVPAKCPNCGATLSVDSNGKAEICQYCGSAFIVDEAKQIFNNTYNITNNITAENVIVEAADPDLQKALQRVKAAIEYFKESDKSKRNNRDFDWFKFEEAADIYFDKAEYQYYYALLMYYRYIASYCRNKEWRNSFEKAIELTSDYNKKLTLQKEYSELKRRQDEKIELAENFFEDFKDKLSNHPEALDGITVSIMREAEATGLFTEFMGVAYLIPINCFGKVKLVKNIKDMMEFFGVWCDGEEGIYCNEPYKIRVVRDSVSVNISRKPILEEDFFMGLGGGRGGSLEKTPMKGYNKELVIRFLTDKFSCCAQCGERLKAVGLFTVKLTCKKCGWIKPVDWGLPHENAL